MAIQKIKEADIPATSISAKPIQSPFALVEKTAAQIHHILLQVSWAGCLLAIHKRIRRVR
jgi:hypothetical protein